MKIRQFYTFGLIVLLMVALITNLSEAASGTGGYYGMPSWDEKLTCTSKTSCPRFEVLTNWSKAAVLDKETGLVWEQSPSTSTFTWIGAQTHCNQFPMGGRFGWRLPAIQELASLLDANATSAPYLPAGHPFSNVQSSIYWSATTDANDTGSAWDVYFSIGGVGTGGKTNTNFVWCVRGGQGVDPQ